MDESWKLCEISLELLGLAEFLVFALGRVPQVEGNGQRRQSHNGKSDPVEEVGRKELIEVSLTGNASLSWLRANGNLYTVCSFGRLVVDLSGCEVKVSESLWANDHQMGEVGLGSNAIDGSRVLSTDQFKGFRMEAFIHCLNIHTNTNYQLK